MPHALPRERSPRHLIHPFIALMLLAGCDLDADWNGDGVELRLDGEITFGTGVDPIPGGGACEECIMDAVLSGGGEKPWKLELCIDGWINYVGTSRSPEDDVTLRSLLRSLPASRGRDWRLISASWFGLSEATLCNSDDSGVCAFATSEFANGSVGLSIEYTTNQADHIPELLRFVPYDAVLGAGPYSPSMKIPAPRIGKQLVCGGSGGLGTKKSVSGLEIPEPVSQIGLAHITSRFPYGGIRSCSGVLVAPDYVLTARHCFPVDESWMTPESDAMNEVHLLSIAGFVDPSTFSVAEVVRHPDQARDLALVRLDKPADPTKFVAMPNKAPEVSGGDDCTLVGRGFGHSQNYPGFDWGNAKAIPVRPVSAEATIYAGFDPDDVAKLLVLENEIPDSRQLCRGDSGGPIVQDCDGQLRIAGVAAARVFETHDSSHGSAAMSIEPLTNAFAFSRGNTCGQGDLVVYVATRIDEDVQDWTAGVIGASIPPQPQPVDPPYPPVEQLQPVDPPYPPPSEQ